MLLTVVILPIVIVGKKYHCWKIFKKQNLTRELLIPVFFKSWKYLYQYASWKSHRLNDETYSQELAFNQLLNVLLSFISDIDLVWVWVILLYIILQNQCILSILNYGKQYFVHAYLINIFSNSIKRKIQISWKILPETYANPICLLKKKKWR